MKLRSTHDLKREKEKGINYANHKKENIYIRITSQEVFNIIQNNCGST